MISEHGNTTIATPATTTTATTNNNNKFCKTHTFRLISRLNLFFFYSYLQNAFPWTKPRKNTKLITTQGIDSDQPGLSVRVRCLSILPMKTLIICTH